MSDDKDGWCTPWLTDSTYVLYDHSIRCKLCGHLSFNERDRQALHCPKCKTHHVKRQVLQGFEDKR